MNQSTMLKKKGPNPKKGQSLFKNLDVDMHYRSTAELANKFKIKREQLGKSKFLGHKSVMRSSSREELRISHMIARKGQTQQRFQTSFKEGVTASVHVTGTTLGNGEVQHDIEDLLNVKQVKRGLDDLVEQEELGGDECDVEEEIDIDCNEYEDESENEYDDDFENEYEDEFKDESEEGDNVYVQLIDSVYSIYSAGSSGNSAAAILYSASWKFWKELVCEFYICTRHRKDNVYLPQGKKSKRLNEEPAVRIRGRTVSSAICSRFWFCRSPEFVALGELIDSVYSIYSVGGSRNSAAAISYRAGNSGNSAAAFCYNTMLEILEKAASRINQSAILKKKGPNPNKGQSPFKNLDVDIQYRSSAELANKFKIKREQLANEHNDRDKKEQAPIPHKRKNSEDFIPQQGKSKFLGQKSVIQSSSREELRISHMIARKGQTKQRSQMSFKEGVTASVHVTGTTLGNGEVQHDIEDLLNVKQVKRKSQGIHNEHDIHDPIINEHNRGLDDLVEQEELGGDECDVEEEIDIDCSTKEEIDIDCSTKERKEVAFDKGQAVGPTSKIVSQLSNFIGTIARNPRFIILMYTSWHAVPKDTKKHMWEYINSKFLIPIEVKKWVIIGLRDAWRRHKQKFKENFFNKNSTFEDMQAKRPDGIPDNQFLQLIEYWKHSTVQDICEMNSQNRKQQKWRHRMGPINFTRVRMALRATKDNNEEPSKPEMFIATRTKMERKSKLVPKLQ
ncbi:hypothetical protein KY284_009164 [Solanum tuberosum]|nr:hypothetical protein KY284_009164 [Solanum tuberosum]